MNLSSYIYLRNCLAAIVFVAGAGVFCEAQTVSVNVRRPEGKLTLASPFALEFEVSHTPGFSVSIDTSLQPSESFVVTKITPDKARAEAGLVKQKFRLETVPFEIGIATFPVLGWGLIPLNAGAAASTATTSFKSPEIPLKIEGIEKETGGTGEIKDIRPPLTPFPWYWAAAMFALAAAFAGWLFYERRKNPAFGEGASAGDNRPADVIAVERLNRLLASDLWTNGNFKEFYNVLADIKRFYLFRRYGLHAFYITTSEICRQLRAAEIDAMTVAAVRTFFESCDIVKFAKFVPDAGQRDRDCRNLREIIEKTKLPAVGDEAIKRLSEP